MKYLQLIKTVTLLHQYQRPLKTVEHHGVSLDYIEVALEDIAIANRLACDVLGRTLDELPPQTRKLLDLLFEWVQAQCQRDGLKHCDYHFSRKLVRDATGWGDTQLKVHLQRLAEMEYLLIHRKGQRFDYELLYAGDSVEGRALTMNLIDLETLRYDGKRSGQKAEQSEDGRPLVGGQSGGGRTQENTKKPVNTASNSDLPQNSQKCSAPEKRIVASYPTQSVLPALAAQATGAVQATDTTQCVESL